MPHDASDFETEFERALAAYADPGDAGYPQVLTSRVMAAVETRRRKLRWWVRISIAIPALACLLVAVLFYSRRPEPKRREMAASIPSSTQSKAALPKTAVTAEAHVEATRHRAVRSAPRQLPKLDQFPAPTALTEQEQVLVQFVTHAPPSTQQLVAKVQKESAKPLRIAELGIPYLDSSTQP